MMRKPILQPPPPPPPWEKIFCHKQMTVRRKSVSHVNIFMPIHPQGFTVHGNYYTLFIRQISFGFNRLQSIY